MNKADNISRANQINALIEIGKRPAGSLWRLLFLFSLLFFFAGLISYLLIFSKGLHVLPLNQSIYWGNLIANFVFWIGIAHAGTFISAILLLLNQNWRMGINRFAEAMTLISIVMSGFFVILHLGKPALVYYILPVQNKTSFFLLNFNSALNWDFYAILTYFIVSLLFFHIGFIPDLAAMRNKSRSKFGRKALNILSMGWTGSFKQWKNHAKVLYLLAGIATPLVISVHSIVSYDFAVTLNPSWHSSLYPVYFVLGALFSGFAMVSILAFITSKIQKLEHFITSVHYSNMSKIMLASSILLAIIFCNEIINALILGSEAEKISMIEKFKGNYALIYILSLIFTLVIPHLFWKDKNRSKGKRVMIISLFILAGMWLERFAIVINSAQYTHLSSAWHSYKINFISIGITAGAIGFMMTVFLLFIRYFPALSVYEIRKKENNKKIE